MIGRYLEYRARAHELEALYREINEAEPCPTPDCVHFRARMLAVARADHKHWWRRGHRSHETKYGT